MGKDARIRHRRKVSRRFAIEREREDAQIDELRGQVYQSTIWDAPIVRDPAIERLLENSFTVGGLAYHTNNPTTF